MKLANDRDRTNREGLVHPPAWNSLPWGIVAPKNTLVAQTTGERGQVVYCVQREQPVLGEGLSSKMLGVYLEKVLSCIVPKSCFWQRLISACGRVLRIGKRMEVLAFKFKHCKKSVSAEPFFLIMQPNLWMQEPLILLWKELFKCAGRWQGIRRLLGEGFFLCPHLFIWLWSVLWGSEDKILITQRCWMSMYMWCGSVPVS